MFEGFKTMALEACNFVKLHGDLGRTFAKDVFGAIDAVSSHDMTALESELNASKIDAEALYAAAKAEFGF